MPDESNCLRVKIDHLNRELIFNQVHLTSYQLIAREIFVDRVYTPDARFLIRPGETVVDIGANIGMFTVYAAALHPQVRVLAFEPAADNYAALCENVRVNALSNVTTCCCAVADRNASQRVLFRDRAGGCHSLLPVTPTRLLGLTKIVGEELVSTRTLGSLFEEFEVQSCDFLKVDCEGAEHSLFRACSSDVLRRIRRVALEYHDLEEGQTMRGLVPFLKENGFVVEPLRRDPGKREEVGMLYAFRA